MRITLVLAVLSAACALSAGMTATGAPAAHAALAVSVVNTDGDGVASRSMPRVDARNGYGAPASAAVTALCWTWGDAVGPFSNRLWWSVQYAGRTFYVADRYLSTPNRANQPPAGQPQCGGQGPQRPDTAADRAAGYARGLVGQVYAGSGDAAQFREETVFGKATTRQIANSPLWEVGGIVGGGLVATYGSRAAQGMGIIGGTYAWTIRYRAQQAVASGQCFSLVRSAATGYVSFAAKTWQGCR